MDGLRGFERQRIHDRLRGVNDAAERRKQCGEAKQVRGEHQCFFARWPDEVAAAFERHDHAVDFLQRAPEALCNLARGHRHRQRRQQLENVEPFLQRGGSIGGFVGRQLAPRTSRFGWRSYDFLVHRFRAFGHNLPLHDPDFRRCRVSPARRARHCGHAIKHRNSFAIQSQSRIQPAPGQSNRCVTPVGTPSLSGSALTDEESQPATRT